MSKYRQWLPAWWWYGAVLMAAWFTLQGPLPCWGDPAGATSGPRGMRGQSPVVLLNGEFFQAMEKLSNSGVVSGDRQEMFLEQIATAARFTVKTNLTIIEQNEKIIRLLEDLNRQGQKEAH
jgi:hypothetical protein